MNPNDFQGHNRDTFNYLISVLNQLHNIGKLLWEIESARDEVNKFD